MSEWCESENASAYLQRADDLPHRSVGERVLLDEILSGVRRILDLGSGDGRLLDLVLSKRSGAVGVALDFSPHMHSTWSSQALRFTTLKTIGSGSCTKRYGLDWSHRVYSAT